MPHVSGKGRRLCELKTMAQLGEAHKLCSGESIGGRPGKNDNQVILSFELGSVQIYDVSRAIDENLLHGLIEVRLI